MWCHNLTMHGQKVNGLTSDDQAFPLLQIYWCNRLDFLISQIPQKGNIILSYFLENGGPLALTHQYHRKLQLLGHYGITWGNMPQLVCRHNFCVVNAMTINSQCIHKEMKWLLFLSLDRKDCCSPWAIIEPQSCILAAYFFCSENAHGLSWYYPVSSHQCSISFPNIGNVLFHNDISAWTMLRIEQM